MNFTIKREVLLPALQALSGVVDRRQTLPILSNLLLKLQANMLSITATDMEVELIINLNIELEQTGELTLPARKLFDICRALPDDAELAFDIKADRTLVKSGKGRFTLTNLPAKEYPVIDMASSVASFKISQKKLEKLLENTQFAMAQQDVRYYLNGLLLEISDGSLRAVATDGHRLALDETEIKAALEEPMKIIVPRKGITELTRLLQDDDSEIEVEISANHIRVKNDNTCFTSKLIDGKFPDYQRVIPDLSKTPVVADREELRNCLARTSILGDEKFRGIRIMLTENELKASANNPQHEEAEEEMGIQYEGDEIEIGFNVSYLLDTLSIIPGKSVKLSVLNPDSSCLILPMESDSNSQYVVMPMRL